MSERPPPDEDFTGYMEARWEDLVRTLVSLGCEPHEAEDVAQTALARCYHAFASRTLCERLTTSGRESAGSRNHVAESRRAVTT